MPPPSTAPRIVVHVGPKLDLLHSSRVLTGLCDLADRGEIALRYEVPAGADAWRTADPVVVCLDVVEPVRRRVAIDLRDGLGLSRPILDRVDVYFKRSFFQPELAGVDEDLRTRVQPFGPNYACRSLSSTIRLARALGWRIASRGRAGLPGLRQYLAVPSPAAFEQPPDVPVEPKVMFQTRLWTPDEIPADEVEPLNEGRVAMVRALRAAFGDRFVGGLVPTPYALAKFPCDVTPHASRKRDYVRVKNRCLVSVYTRGVEHSLGFKLGEALAASQCLVAVPLRYELPRPLLEGEHYLPFESPDDAVDACRRLLEDPALAARMRRANHEYYRQEVAPAVHMARVVSRACALPAADRAASSC